MANIQQGFVASVGPSGSQTAITTPSGNNSDATGDGFYIVTCAGQSTVPTITDTYGNNYTQIGSIITTPINNFYICRFYCQNGAGGANHEFTATWGAASGCYLSAVQIQNGSLTSLYSEQSNDAVYLSTASNPLVTGNVALTPPVTGALMIASLNFALSTSQQGTITEGNGFSLAAMGTAVVSENMQVGTLFQSGSGSQQASWNSTEAGTSSTRFIAVIDAFYGRVTAAHSVAGPTPRCIFIMP